MKVLDKFADEAYALLRIVAGFMFAIHGAQKMFGILGGHRISFGDDVQIWIGGLIELVTGTLIMVGFQSRIAAFLASGTMAVAYIQFHWKLQFDSAFFPAVNRGELALLYSFVFLYIACRGAGKWSIDSCRCEARK